MNNSDSKNGKPTRPPRAYSLLDGERKTDRMPLLEIGDTMPLPAGIQEPSHDHGEVTGSSPGERTDPALGGFTNLVPSGLTAADDVRPRADDAEAQRARRSPDLTGQTIADRYSVQRLIGTGGMGSVYCVRDVELNEVVALKMLHRYLYRTEGMLARFRQEVKLARRVTHPNVARTFDIGEHQGQKFLTMEYVEGESLGALLRREKLLALHRSVEILLKLCAGLAAAHAVGVVHRDLKPDNVLVSKEGRIVITDFGIAHSHREAGASAVFAVGTPAYMAPEQVEGAPDVDARADLYALGAVAYELFTGQRAWTGESSFEVLHARLSCPPPDPRAVHPELPQLFADVVLRMMATRREDRFVRAEDVAVRMATAPELLMASRMGTSPTSTSQTGEHRLSVASIKALRAATTPGPPDSVDRTALLSSQSTGALQSSVSLQSPLARQSPLPAQMPESLAVLPFRNFGPPSEEYIADGLSEDLLTALSSVPTLKVRPRSVVARYRGRDLDPCEAGRELGVDVVVEGSVRKAAEIYRMSVKLVQVKDGAQLWARRIDCATGDLLVASDDFSRAIIEQLSAIAPAAPPRTIPVDPEGVELYLRARYEMRNGWHSLGGITRAVELADQAVTRLASEPLIVSLCAVARARLAFVGSGGHGRGDTLGLAEQAAERAVNLAPHLGESWLALASVRQSENRPSESVGLLRQAIAVAPTLAKGWEMLGRILLEVGQLQSAIEHLETALRLEPGVAEPRWDLARAFAMCGAWNKVDAILDLPVEDSAARYMQRFFRFRLGLWRRPSGSLPQGSDEEIVAEGLPRMLVIVYREVLSSGAVSPENRDFFVTQVEQVNARLKPVIWQYEAETVLGAEVIDHERALAAVESAVGAGLVDISWLDYCPLLAPLRSDPRWAALRAQISARIQSVIEAVAAL